MRIRFLHIVLILLLAFPAFAQKENRPFKVDVGILCGEAHKHDIGLLAPYIEPKFSINKHFTVGVRAECVFYKKDGFIDYDPNNPYWTDIDAAGRNLSAVAIVDYYFNDNFIRPFIGAGIGYYYMYVDQENTYIESFTEKGGGIGFVPRLGLNIGQIKVACEYNIINSDDFDLDYFSIKIGYEIGGGRKKF